MAKKFRNILVHTACKKNKISRNGNKSTVTISTVCKSPYALFKKERDVSVIKFHEFLKQ